MNRSPALHEITAAEKEFDLAAMLDVFILYRRMILSIFGILSVLGIAAVLLSDPQYQASIVTQVDEGSAATTASSLLGQDLSSMLDVKSSADTEMQVFRSRLVVAAAVDDLHLYIQAEPARFPVVGRAIARANKGFSPPGFLGMGGYTWGDERADVERFDVPARVEGETYRLTVLDVQSYRLSGPGLERDVVGLIGKTEKYMSDEGPITLHVNAIRAVAGARFNLTRQSRLEAIDKLQRSLSISEQGKDSNVLQVKLRGTDPALVTEILNHVAHHYIDQNEVRKAEQAARSLSFLRSQVPDLRQKLDMAESAYSVIRSKLGSVDVEGEAREILQQSAENETQIVMLQQKRAEALSRFAPANPAVAALDQQIAVLQAQSSGLSQRIDSLPETQRQVVKIQRDVKISNDLYVGLLNNIEQLQILQAGRVGNVRILDDALLPDRPVRLRRALMCVVVVALALFAAAGAAFIRDLLFRGISDLHEIEEWTDLSVFSVVPMARRRQLPWFKYLRRNAPPRRPLAFVDPADPAIESLRSLRTALQFSLSDTGDKVVMFTGPSPNVGKSFIASNIAAVLARTGKRVLLIDGDLRRCGLSRAFGFTSTIGLSDVIADPGKLDASIRKIERSPLDFLPAGSMPSNAADHLSNPNVLELFKTLSACYDVIVIDTAPLLPVPDAVILAPYSSGNVFLVARASVTKPAELEECARRLRQVDVEVKGVVLNGIDRHAGRFRYGITYGSYRYARSRGEEPRPAMDGAEQ
ncbi:polysaccharide biosynthesis tyrosine autokinase [Paraburkholderia terricola]|uniref:polysaccharide biosynthesis tyrosine autokinase n=1 Tax=Paraburkholderia terricola TaxID=169427 RepID=UPI00285B839B|nr:polysaccharide biosynthesis tyrosine autokinase [Paraburkholderia terricola]MDR6479228.1 tyrosine-protein kinase Etk/Wzc [Paraburkholderia terricola]